MRQPTVDRSSVTQRLLTMVIGDEAVAEAILGDLAEEFHDSRWVDLTRARYWVAAVRVALGFRIARLSRSLRADAASPSRHNPPLRSAMLGSVWRDVRSTLRGLRRSPGFAAATLLTLALGIGATTTVFSVVNGVLLKPLPYADADRLVGVWLRAPGLPADWLNMNQAAYFTFRDENRVFEDVALWDDATLTVTGGDEAEQVAGMEVTDGLFPLLGVEPMIGRTFTPDDMDPGAATGVILGYGYWQRRYGGDRGVVGSTLTVNGEVVDVIGVMPRGFRMLFSEADIYFPGQFDRFAVAFGGFRYQGIARLREGVTVEQASADVGRMIPMAIDAFPGGWTHANAADVQLGPRVHPLKDEVIGSVGEVLWILLGTVALVLVIACANVANLLLVRADGRQREVAIRAALGASRRRLTQAALSESVVLGLLGGVGGVALAYTGIRLLIQIGPTSVPRLHAVSLNGTVLAFAVLVSLFTGLLFGMVAVARYRGANLFGALKEGGIRIGMGRRAHYGRNLLVVSQLALALVLLVGSGLMIRSYLALNAVDPGFGHPEEVLTLRIIAPGSGLSGGEGNARLHQELIRRIEALPGVVSVGASSSVTMDRGSGNNTMHIEDFPTPEGEMAISRRLKWIAGDYFETMGNPLLAGRTLNWDDVRARAPVVVITENMALEYWASPAAALGRRIRQHTGPWRKIVGVVGNVHDNGVDRPPVTVVYLPLAVEDLWGFPLLSWRNLAYVVRTDRPNPTSLVPEIRHVVAEANPDIPIANIRTLNAILARSMARTSFAMVMLAIAAAAALLLGLVGTYGVISYAVSRRTHEIGVRVALGASAGQVSRRVLRQGLGLTLVGVMVGLAAAYTLSHLMAAMLFGIGPVDGPTYAAVAIALTFVALVATWLPARRAARVDPMVALREE